MTSLSSAPPASDQVANQNDVRCPVCGTRIQASPTARYDSQQAANHFCATTRSVERNQAFERVIRRLWNGPTCEIYECPHCTHGFAWPHVAGDAEFYELMHANAGYPAARWEYHAFVDALPAASGEPRAHLDIGTGDGSFLRLLPTDYVRYGTESTDVMRKQLADKGIQTFHDVDAALGTMAGGFDSVTMFQVIEHIADFRPLLSKCLQLLKPGGLLGMSVPSGAFKSTQERLTGAADMPPNHVNRWTPKSMGVAMANAGFEPRATKLAPTGSRALLASASLKTLAVATTQPRSLTAQCYRIKNRTLRRSLFSVAGAFNLLSLLPHRRELLVPQEFLCIGQRPLE